jgi:FtsP/CotA-like multicopper oxidase with cupredoxin domain/peroxiredoxin
LQRDIVKANKLDNASRTAKVLISPPRVELVLTTGTFPQTATAEVDPTIPRTFELLCYNGEPVGPTLRVKRGETFQIYLKNALNVKGVGPDPGPDARDDGNHWESIHGLCTTNLHTHGLHVSPADPSDNVLRCIDPGQEYTYTFTIPGDHPSGTFWYHPHKHGSVAYQLANGVAGALIVEGDSRQERDLESIPEIREASQPDHERILVIQLYTFRAEVDQPGAAPVGRIDASVYDNGIYNINLNNLKSCEAVKVSGKGTPNQAYAVNGVINPTYHMRPGEVQRWRIIYAGWQEISPLVWADEQGNETDALQFHEIAVDGLATGTMRIQKPLTIAPGQRSDSLIQAPKLPDGKDRMTFHLKRRAVPSALATDKRPTDPLFLAKVVVSGTPCEMKLPDAHRLKRCRPFEAIADEELSPPTIPNGTLAFFANDPPSGTPPDMNNGFYMINSQTFHQQSSQPVQIQVGTTQEWTLTAAASNHPFHIHVNPFQVVSYTDANGFTVPMDLWRDTLYIPEGTSYKIRSRFEHFAGKSVIHCHILDHEDQGMMMLLQYNHPDPNKPAPPQDLCARPSAPRALKTSSVAAPALALPRATGGTARLSDLKSRSVVLVFFLGAECGHCAEQLRNLVREMRNAARDTEIVAVSSLPVTNAPKTLGLLGVKAEDRFQLLVDTRHEAFRAYGCLDADDALHGLFLIDGAGVIRARYTGRSPFDNPREVVRLVGSMKNQAKTASASR